VSEIRYLLTLNKSCRLCVCIYLPYRNVALLDRAVITNLTRKTRGKNFDSILKLLRSPGIDSSLCSLAGRYDNPIPTHFLALIIDCSKIPALEWEYLEERGLEREGVKR
jgi:hypothetical protein